MKMKHYFTDEMVKKINDEIEGNTTITEKLTDAQVLKLMDQEFIAIKDMKKLLNYWKIDYRIKNGIVMISNNYIYNLGTSPDRDNRVKSARFYEYVKPKVFGIMAVEDNWLLMD